MIVKQGRHQSTRVKSDFISAPKKVKTESTRFDYHSNQSVQKPTKLQNEYQFLSKNSTVLIKDYEKMKIVKCNTMKSNSNCCDNDKCLSPISKEQIVQSGKESIILNSPVFQDKLKQKQGNRKTSIANLYTPNIKMSFCSSQKITPVLKSRRDSDASGYKSIEKSKRQLMFSSHKSTPDLNSPICNTTNQGSSKKLKAGIRNSVENRTTTEGYKSTSKIISATLKPSVNQKQKKIDKCVVKCETPNSLPQEKVDKDSLFQKQRSSIYFKFNNAYKTELSTSFDAIIDKIKFDRLKNLKTTPKKNCYYQSFKEDEIQNKVKAKYSTNQKQLEKIEENCYYQNKNFLLNVEKKNKKKSISAACSPQAKSSRNNSCNRTLDNQRDVSKKNTLEQNDQSSKVRNTIKPSQSEANLNDESKINKIKINLSKETESKVQPTKCVISKKQIEQLQRNNISRPIISQNLSNRRKNIDVMQVSLLVEHSDLLKPNISTQSTDKQENKLATQTFDNSKLHLEIDTQAMVNEMTEEETASIRSLNKLDTSSNVNDGECKEASTKQSCDLRNSIIETERVDSVNNFTVNSPIVRDEIEDLDEFVKNITHHLKEEDSEESDYLELDSFKDNEENVLEIEYYGLNKSNISKDSIANKMKSSRCYQYDNFDLESKKSMQDTSNFLEMNNNFNIQKDLGTNSIMELYKEDINSELSISNKISYAFKRNENDSGIRICQLDCSDSESNEYSLNISENLQNSSAKKFDYLKGKEDFSSKGVHDFLSASHHKRKHSLQNQSINFSKHFSDLKPQSEDGIDDEELFKMSCDKTSESSVQLNLSNCKEKDQKSTFAKIRIDENSDCVFKDECSTLQEYSNLCSSKGYSMVEYIKISSCSRNNCNDDYSQDPIVLESKCSNQNEARSTHSNSLVN